jgi:hypothetical protein
LYFILICKYIVFKTLFDMIIYIYNLKKKSKLVEEKYVKLVKNHIYIYIYIKMK